MEPLLFSNKIYYDDRGFFTETYLKKKKFEKFKFIQDNFSYSVKGVIRGLHYQLRKPQTKLLTVLSGKIYDVVIDIRKKSSNFGKVYTFHLNSKKSNQLFIPKGFAHGFQCLSSSALIFYKCDNYYKPDDQYGINYNDKTIKIKWPIKKNILSKKDKLLPNIKHNKNLFK